MTTDNQHQCEWKQVAESLQAELAAIREQQARLQHQHEVLLRQRFGKRSEKMGSPSDELRKRGDIARQTPEERKEARDKGRAWKDELETRDVPTSSIASQN